MKRGGPLPRRKRLQARAALNRAAELTRSAMKATSPKRDPAEAAARRVVRARSAGRCEVCGVRAATNFHHRLNRSGGGRWDATNGLDLCGSGTTGCHGEITTNPKRAREQGWSVPSYADPARTPTWIYGREFVLLTPHGTYENEEAA